MIRVIHHVCLSTYVTNFFLFYILMFFFEKEMFFLPFNLIGQNKFLIKKKTLKFFSLFHIKRKKTDQSGGAKVLTPKYCRLKAVVKCIATNYSSFSNEKKAEEGENVK